MQEFALFGPSEQHSVIKGGFCISVFAISKTDAGVLLMKPTEHPRWKEEWAPNWRLYEPDLLSKEYKLWRFPSSYVREGESPEQTLTHVMLDQLGIQGYSVSSSELLNFYEPSRRHPGRMHWDYCFVYNVRVGEVPTPKPWMAVVDYVDPKGLGVEDFGSAQGGLAKALKLV